MCVKTRSWKPRTLRSPSFSAMGCEFRQMSAPNFDGWTWITYFVPETKGSEELLCWEENEEKFHYLTYSGSWCFRVGKSIWWLLVINSFLIYFLIHSMWYMKAFDLQMKRLFAGAQQGTTFPRSTCSTADRERELLLLSQLKFQLCFNSSSSQKASSSCNVAILGFHFWKPLLLLDLQWSFGIWIHLWALADKIYPKPWTTWTTKYFQCSRHVLCIIFSFEYKHWLDVV